MSRLDHSVNEGRAAWPRAATSGRTLYCPRLFDGWNFHARVRLELCEGRVAALEVGVPPGAGDEVLPAGSVVAPGLVDIQLNGGGGQLFNDAPSVETIEAIAQAHRRRGTTAFLPTLITDTRDTVERAVAAAREACTCVAGVLGIHLEGPFLDVERRGIHQLERIARFGATAGGVEADVRLLTALGDVGRTLVTVAPEHLPEGAVRSLVERGAIVFAGHTAATFVQMKAAFAEGLSGFTHLFNAMSQLSAREPGAVGAALLHPSAWAGLVLDGFHVAPGSVDVLRAARGFDRVALVSDAMPPAGSDATAFVLHGTPIRVEGGRCVSEGGTLAGSLITLADAVRIGIEAYRLAPQEALACAARIPAELLGRSDLGVFKAGARADAVVFDPAWRPLGVLQHGCWVVPLGIAA